MILSPIIVMNKDPKNFNFNHNQPTQIMINGELKQIQELKYFIKPNSNIQVIRNMIPVQSIQGSQG